MWYLGYDSESQWLQDEITASRNREICLQKPPFGFGIQIFLNHQPRKTLGPNVTSCDIAMLSHSDGFLLLSYLTWRALSIVDVSTAYDATSKGHHDAQHEESDANAARDHGTTERMDGLID